MPVQKFIKACVKANTQLLNLTSSSHLKTILSHTVS
ncbi:hypothetical protein PLUTE_b6012 [Pseudoalteromonas luteoviolacea DSM 6061]|nr:hypothetical protein [Pseudoalteromonas luteoviolacea DSM 6061]